MPNPTASDEIRARQDERKPKEISMNPSINTHGRYLPYLLLLFTLFLFRVVGQLVQFFYPISFLPPFSSWQSGALAYRWLFGTQIFIIILFSITLRGFARQTTRPNHRWGKWLIGVGSIYLGVMVLRLLAGVTVAKGHPWWGATIPAFFHLVLATFILLVGHFHLRFAGSQSTYRGDDAP